MTNTPTLGLPSQEGDDMLSLRNFEDLFGRFVRVLRQHEMNRAVKSKKITGTEGNKSCHDFHYRGAILSPEKNDVLNH